MIVENLGMVLQEGNRSKAYLQKLVKANLLPSFVLLLKNSSNPKEKFNINPQKINSEYFDPTKDEKEILDEAKISYLILQASSCNEDCVVEELSKRPEEVFVFSGAGILNEVFKTGKKFIHVHPGKLPEFRGSTCPYYSTLKEGKWCCTGFIMNPGIDEGDLLLVKEFPLPSKGVDPTRIYDPHTRSEVLVLIVDQLRQNKKFKIEKQDLSQGIDYYLIHPVLEYIAKQSYEVK